MPPTDVIMVKCPLCPRTFQSQHAARIHIGHAHPDAGPPPAKRARVAEAPPPCPVFDPEEWELGEDGVDGAADVGAVDVELPAEDYGPDGREALLAKIRRQALELLTRPRWRQWAQDMLGWAEENLLSHMEDMFPEAGHFMTPETFRFLQLRSLHPGAAFGKELLKAAQDEPLDLAKVRAAFVNPIPICDLRCQAYAGHMPHCDSNVNPLARNLLSPRCRHMPGIFSPHAFHWKSQNTLPGICPAYA